MLRPIHDQNLETKKLLGQPSSFSALYYNISFQQVDNTVQMKQVTQHNINHHPSVHSNHQQLLTQEVAVNHCTTVPHIYLQNSSQGTHPQRHSNGKRNISRLVV